MAFLELADVAADQWGLVTTAQARRAGTSPQTVAKLANRGALDRLAHGVYRLAGTPPDAHDELRAAWLALDPEYFAAERLRLEPPEVVSHRSAARLWQLGDTDADRHEFIVATRRQSRRPDIRFHRGRLRPTDWTIVDGLPVTAIPRTIADLTAGHIDGGHLAGIVRDAVVHQHVDVDVLAETLLPHARAYGTPVDDGEALLRVLLATAGVPDTTRHAASLAAEGTTRAS